MFGDNKKVVDGYHDKLDKFHTALTFHMVCKAIASKIVCLSCEC